VLIDLIVALVKVTGHWKVVIYEVGILHFKQDGDEIKLLRYKVLTHTQPESSGSRHLITASIYSTPPLVEV
jgi:hypothetical protein